MTSKKKKKKNMVLVYFLFLVALNSTPKIQHSHMHTLGLFSSGNH